MNVSIPVRVLDVLKLGVDKMIVKNKLFVSIPVRVLDVLKHRAAVAAAAHPHVSIPVRVLDVLKPYSIKLNLIK